MPWVLALRPAPGALGSPARWPWDRLYVGRSLPAAGSADARGWERPDAEHTHPHAPRRRLTTLRRVRAELSRESLPSRRGTSVTVGREPVLTCR